MEPKKSRLESVLAKLALVVILVAGVLLLIVMSQLGEAKYVVKETAAYTRVSNCIVAKSGSSERTIVDVEACYTQVEKDSGIPLERFDQQTHNEESPN